MVDASHGRGLPSSWPLILGGFIWRTPAKGDGEAQGLDCKLSYSSRVIFVKNKTFSIDRRFPKAILEKRPHLMMYLSPFNENISRSFQTLTAMLKKD
jgi:hypothetical protein